MVVENEKDYIGIESGEDVYKKEIKDKLIYAAMTLGKIFYE